MEETTDNNTKSTQSFLNSLIYVEDTALTTEMCVNLINYYNLYYNSDNTSDNEPLNLSYSKLSYFFLKPSEIGKEIIDEFYNSIIEHTNKYFNSNKLLSNHYDMYKNIIIPEYKFQIIKYEQNIGIFEYHDDFTINKDDNFCILTFIWYLNDVDNGGETEFFDEIKIKPKQGRLLIFPSVWPYLHKGNIPLSSDKYILTGWVYAKNLFKTLNQIAVIK